MTNHGPLTQGQDFKDRKTWLVVFGILQIIFGWVGAIQMFFIMINTIISPVLDDSNAPPKVNGGLNVFYFTSILFLLLWSIWTGVGSIKARRWARVLILYSSWIELIGVVFEFILLLWFVAVGGLGSTSITPWLLVGIPSLMFACAFVLFYGSKNVKATCELRDSHVRWNDKHTWLVPTAIVMFGVCMASSRIIGDYIPMVKFEKTTEWTNRSSTVAIVEDGIEWWRKPSLSFWLSAEGMWDIVGDKILDTDFRVIVNWLDVTTTGYTVIEAE